MNKLLLFFAFILVIIFGVVGYLVLNNRNQTILPSSISQSTSSAKQAASKDQHPLSIEAMRAKEYPGSEFKIEQELADGVNFEQFIVSYQSDGLKINGLLTVPKGEKPAGGWPAIVFNHGYIPPEQYRTTERYGDYLNGFASKGYIVFKPEYRGHGSSEGEPEGAYFAQGYTTDVLNALASLKQYKQVNPSKIGMWGHSLGGFLTLKSMVIVSDIKAGVIWAGVVGSYREMFEIWFKNSSWRPSEKEMQSRRINRDKFVEQYGTPEKNPEFWNSISAINYVQDISGPVQIHHGTADTTVPIEFSDSLEKELKNKQKVVEYYKYQGADHNLAGVAFPIAMQRSVEFFDRYLK